MTAEERVYRLLTFLSETEMCRNSDYIGVLASAIEEWSNNLRLAGVIVTSTELCSAPFMVLRADPATGRDVYYGVDFDEALDWFHSVGAIDTAMRDSLRLQRTLDLMEDG